jgi:transcription antitermination factor NusG
MRIAGITMGLRPAVPARYPEERSLEDDLGIWWVLHTKPNCEKQVASYLFNRHIGYYLPLCRRRVGYGNLGKTRTSEAPLFRGYVCLALPKRDHQLLYDTSKVVRLIKVDNQLKFVKELQAVARLAETHEDLLVRHGLLPGRRVLILSGVMAGHEGVVVKRRSEKQLALSVEIFNQTVLVRLDPATVVEPL